MNLNEDFIAIQGILLSADKSTGVLKKIKHRGGNEIAILNVITELHKLLSAKNYIKNRKINDAFRNELINICTFLLLNTELKIPLDQSEFEHLINITPQISTCLLANVIVGLDLSPYFCKALQEFSLNIAEELMVEVIPCIKKCKPKVHVQNAYEFLKFMTNQLSVASDKQAEAIDHLTDAASQMLLNLTGLHGDQVQGVKIDSVYECMGHTLLNLIELLISLNEKNPTLRRIIEKIIKTCCSLVMAVTIDVFCSWAEVEYQGEVLQSLITGKSYMFIEKYHKCPLAKELISMLGNIAQKPKSVSEQIQKATVPTMIIMINKADINQKQWFVALLNTQVLNCKDSLKCLEKWTHLCTLGDVSRLLNLSVHTKEDDAKNVVVKCASALDFDELVLATTRHFHQNGIINLKENVQQNLVLLFNKIKDKTISDEFSKELYLLLLQNMEQTLAYIFAECLKNTFYSSNLVSLWPHIKEIITINEIGVRVLKHEIDNNLPSAHNCRNYVELLNTLVQMNVFSAETLSLKIILPLLKDSKENYEMLRYTLEVLKDLQGNISLTQETECLFSFLFYLMKSCRCNFLNFNGSKQEIVKLSVDIIEKYSNLNYDLPCTVQMVKYEDFFVSYYSKKLLKQEVDILKHFFPINFDNHAEIVAHLIKILPLCVTPEWTMISTNLLQVCQIEKTIELLCDSMILLCELVNSQETRAEEVKRMLYALKYCLQNLGVSIKEYIQPRISDLKEDVALTKNVCRLLREIPTGDLKSEEGLSLASLLSDSSLKYLRPDKKFACLVASIHESHVCKMLAQKILS